MSKHKTIRAFLKNCIELANQPIWGLLGEKKLTEDEQRKVSELTAVLQNELSEMQQILTKYNLKY